MSQIILDRLKKPPELIGAVAGKAQGAALGARLEADRCWQLGPKVVVVIARELGLGSIRPIARMVEPKPPA